MRDHKIKQIMVELHHVLNIQIGFFLYNHSAIAIFTIEMGCTLYESRFEEQPEA